MPDRLSELIRQRALVSEHLAWLDREIASVIAKPAAPSVEPVAIAPASISAPDQPPTNQTAALVSSTGAPTATQPGEIKASDTEEILDQYRVAPAAVKEDVRKGCLLYFAAAFVLLGVIVTILYFAIGSH